MLVFFCRKWRSSIGFLAALGIPALNAFIGRARQAEPQNVFAHLHTLQASHQLHADHYARWGQTSAVGYVAAGDAANSCTITNAVASKGQDAVGTESYSGAFQLGWKPGDCPNFRYRYWIEWEGTGTESYALFAYAPSDSTKRIYPTCDGVGMAGRGAAKLSITTDVSTTAVESTEATGAGDMTAMDNNKKRYGLRAAGTDVVEACSQ